MNFSGRYVARTVVRDATCSRGLCFALSLGEVLHEQTGVQREEKLQEQFAKLF